MDPTSSTFAIYFDRVKLNCNFIYSRQLLPSQHNFSDFWSIEEHSTLATHGTSSRWNSALFLKHENSIKNIYLFLESCWKVSIIPSHFTKLTKNFQSVAVRPTKSQWSDTFVLIQTRIYASCGNEKRAWTSSHQCLPLSYSRMNIKKRANNTTHK